jgi:hypothetical protein
MRLKDIRFELGGFFCALMMGYLGVSTVVDYFHGKREGILSTVIGFVIFSFLSVTLFWASYINGKYARLRKKHKIIDTIAPQRPNRNESLKT